MYFKCKTSNFFQIDCSPVGTRLASHSDQVVFYNTKTSTFNSIQVKNVYNYSDARAKANIQSFKNGLGTITQLRPVSYTFSDSSDKNTYRIGGNGTEIGLLAQEVEKVLPNIVITDPDGKKLINYTAIIPVMIDAIKTLQAEVDELKKQK
nr:tail fiber domain-containing protein [Bacteroides eggerthii]